MLMTAATVVRVLHGLFYVLLQPLFVAALTLSFEFYCKFHCKFYCSCDPSFRNETEAYGGTIASVPARDELTCGSTFC